MTNKNFYFMSITRFIIIVIIAFLFNSCKIYPYFKTPNDFSRQKITIDLLDGKQLNGEASIYFEERIQAPDYIEVNATGDSSKKRIPVKSIKGYTYNNEYYSTKYVDLFFTGTYHLLFLKRLTKENSKIQFYELHQLFKSNDEGREAFYYFISLPGHSQFETWDINSKNLVPDFDLKMSAIVDDCPSLATKIKEKKDGYFLPKINFSNSKKVEVFQKIIEEYNNCK